MKSILIAYVSGLLFGLGLIVAGMVQPAKIIGFLDIFGNWDPTLGFVMAGAILVHGVSYYFIKRRISPLCDTKFYVASKSKIDAGLIIGSALFGVGWGLSGLCPGPSIVGLAMFSSYIIYFVLSMLMGIIIYRSFFDNKTEQR